MKLTDLEKDVMLEFFNDKQIDTAELFKSLDEIEVLTRDVAGTGFFTKLERHPCLRVGPSDLKYTGGGADGYINRDKIKVGFLFYIEEGYITAFEGHTYGELWPSEIECYGID